MFNPPPRSHAYQLPLKLPLRTTLVVAFTLQVMAAVGLVGYISFRGGQRAVNNLSSQLRSELTARIERELRTYFETPHELNRLNAAAFARGDLDVIKSSYGEGQLYQQMKIAPTVAFVYCGSARSGEFFGVLRTTDEGSRWPELNNDLLQLSYSNTDTNFLRRYYQLDVNGDRTHFVRQTDKPYDSRQRPWFTAATSRQGPAWTDIYIAFTTGLPNITASLPVYDKSGRQLLGVCGTDVVLPDEFRDFLRNLEIGKTGQAFVVARDGTLISNSTDEPLMQGEGDTATALPAIASQDNLVRSTANYLLNRFGNFGQIQAAQQLAFQLDGQRQFLEVLPFKDPFGLDWLIVVTVPETDFMEQIAVSNRNTLISALAALTVAIGGGVMLARWVTHSLLSLTRASKAMAEGNLDQHVNENSPIIELDTLAHAFNTMIGQLQTSFDALSQSEITNRAIVAAIPDLMIRAQRDGTYLEIVGRDRLQHIHGVKKFSPGSSVRASLPSNLADLRMHHIHQALATGELQVYEQRLTLGEQPQDEEVRILVLGPDEVLIMVRDITARKQNEKLREENLRMGAELDVARQIQQMILPKADELDQVKGLDIAGYMEPADEVGGDYYDVLQTDGVVTIGIGDVTGHGLESGLMMLMTQTAVRTLQEIREQDPVRFLDTLNRTIYHNVQRMNSDRNLTLAILTYAAGQLSISGQHEEALVIRGNGTVERIDTMDLGLPIGLDDDIAEFIAHALVTLEPGDGVVLYTDGIPEAYNANRKQYGMDRFCAVISQNWQGSSEVIKQAIIDDLQTFIGKQKVFDDITLLVLKQQ
ncbi:MAG: SpoIIE family protein phosphatase [Leptolyngbya sp. RL_3_1]|nr:SpoIIE family protein phosphatase [Leptolyngbya sp. RL_3_1]